MEFIYTKDKTLAAVLISHGRKPMSALNGEYTFIKDDETLKFCQDNFDSSKYLVINKTFC